MFLRLEKDFVSYTPRRRENLHENLNNLRRELIPEKLELTIRKEVWDGASAWYSFHSSSNTAFFLTSCCLPDTPHFWSTLVHWTLDADAMGPSLHSKRHICFFFFNLQLCDFAKRSQNSFYVYNDIEHFKDEPHVVRILSEEDIHVTEEIYKRALFTLPSYRSIKHLLGFEIKSHLAHMTCLPS